MYQIVKCYYKPEYTNKIAISEFAFLHIKLLQFFLSFVWLQLTEFRYFSIYFWRFWAHFPVRENFPGLLYQKWGTSKYL